MKAYVLALFLIGSWTNVVQTTGMLETLQDYASTVPEYPRIAKKIWGNSDFSEFYKENPPSIVVAFLESLGYQPKGFFSIRYFENLLREVLGKRRARKLSGELVAKIACQDPSKIFIIGNLRGEFHSAVRILTWLHEQGVINEDLVFTHKDYYLVFDGYSVNGSAYSLETLTVILLLLNRNQDRVFWLRSRQENHTYWYDLSLKRSLRERGKHITSDGSAPLVNELDDFFATLPYVLYVCLKKNHLEFIKLSTPPEGRFVVDESYLDGLFNQSASDKAVYYDILQKKPTEERPIIKAEIKAQEWFLESEQREGLYLVEHEKGAPVWSVFPFVSPNDTDAVTSMKDSYVMIDLHGGIQESSISFFERRGGAQSKSFVCVGTWNVASGVSKKSSSYGQPLLEPIRIGSSMALVKGVPIMGKEVKNGLFAHVNEVNGRGGINGHLIQVTVYNDDYVPAIAQENIRKLMADSIDLIMLPIGSPTLNLYLDLVKENKISVLFPLTGGPLFRDPQLKGIMHLRGGYDNEAFALVKYLRENFGVNKFAFFYQDDAYGQGPLKAAHQALQELNITTKLDLAYTRASVDFSTQVQKIREYQPDAIGLFATAQAAERLLRQIGVAEGMNRYLFGISFLGEHSFRQFIKFYGIRVFFGAVIPNPFLSQTQIAQEYRKAMDNIKSSYDVFSFEAYVAASLLTDIVGQVEEPITREKIMAKFESLHNYNFKGLMLSFDPNKRSLAESIWIETGDDSEWIEKKITQSVR